MAALKKESASLLMKWVLSKMRKLTFLIQLSRKRQQETLLWHFVYVVRNLKA